MGATTVVLAGLIGCFLGAIAGYFGHGTDEVVTKITEIFLAFPFLLLAIALMAFLEKSHKYHFSVDDESMGSVLSRRARRGLSLKERDFVTAAKALGGKDFYVLLKHVVPNTFASVTVIATLLWPSSSSPRPA